MQTSAVLCWTLQSKEKKHKKKVRFSVPGDVMKGSCVCVCDNLPLTSLSPGCSGGHGWVRDDVTAVIICQDCQQPPARSAIWLFSIMLSCIHAFVWSWEVRLLGSVLVVFYVFSANCRLVCEAIFPHELRAPRKLKINDHIVPKNKILSNHSSTTLTTNFYLVNPSKLFLRLSPL